MYRIVFLENLLRNTGFMYRLILRFCEANIKREANPLYSDIGKDNSPQKEIFFKKFPKFFFFCTIDLLSNLSKNAFFYLILRYNSQ